MAWVWDSGHGEIGQALGLSGGQAGRRLPRGFTPMVVSAIGVFFCGFDAGATAALDGHSIRDGWDVCGLSLLRRPPWLSGLMGCCNRQEAETEPTGTVPSR